MSYLAIARKWRPTKFEDLVGQLHVVQTLKNAILFDRVSHSYLFCGARGIGKTSVARIFAKALRCPNAKEATPCNECEECVQISESRSVDVVEIDGASNNGVEAVRSIRDNVAYGAASGKYKVYIIDEVHMLSTAAFNALLKTLEEPPPYVIFIFATTEVQKIPLTILSRCQRFEFKRLTNIQIVERLKHILTTEKLQIEEEGLRTIAQHGDGSLRDSLSLLDQVLSFFSGKESITSKEVVEALGVTEGSTITAFWKAIIEKDVKSLFEIIGDAYMAGVDLKHFAEGALEELRLLYLVSLAQEGKSILSATELDISEGHFQQLIETSKKAAPIQFERMAQVFSKAISQLSFTSLPRFVLEMAAIRMTKLEELDKIQKALLGETAFVSPPAVAKPVVTPAPSASAPTPPPAPIASGTPDDMWKGFVEVVMKKRPILGTLLTHANYKLEKNGKTSNITIAFSVNSFYEKQIKDQKNYQDVMEQAKTYFGPDAVIQFSNVTQNTNESLEAIRSKEAEHLRRSALEHPAVEKFKTALNAEVIDVHVDM